MNERITIEEIKELLLKYDIGARPLSCLLGWERNTIYYYKKGQNIPRITYSNKLKELNNSINMCYLLLQNKTKISKVAFKKCEKSLKYMKKYE